MSEVTRDLKLKDDPSTIVRPNIVPANIPSRAIDASKMKVYKRLLRDYLEDCGLTIDTYTQFANALNRILRGEVGFVIRFYYDSLTEDEYTYTLRIDSSNGSGTYMYYADNEKISIEDEGDYEDFLRELQSDDKTIAEHIYVVALEF